MRQVHVVVPAGIDDPARPSGGNRYDRRLCDGLAERGWTVIEHPVAGNWPSADASARGTLRALVDDLPTGALLLVDGLIGGAAPELLEPAAARLRLIALVHLPLGVADPDAAAGERRVLLAAAGVVCTSGWTRCWLADRYGSSFAAPPNTAARVSADGPLAPKGAAAETLGGGRVVVAVPGVDSADRADRTPGGGELLCAAAVVPHKGQDLLTTALGAVAELDWRCRLVGSVDLDPTFTDRVVTGVRAAGLAERVSMTGPLTGAALSNAFAKADLLVVPSRIETYGMTVVEALARGIPVLAAAVGGVPEAMGTAGWERPGLLVPPDDPTALAGALRRWLTSAELRATLRAAADRRRETLGRWSATAAVVDELLLEVAASTPVSAGVSS